MYLPTYPQNGQGDDDPSGDGRFDGRGFGDGFERQPGLAGALVESDRNRPLFGLSQPVSPWTGLLKGLNAAADAFAAAAQQPGKDRNAALAKGLDAATQVITNLSKPPSAEAMRRFSQPMGIFGRESSSPRRRTYPPGYDIDPGFAPVEPVPFPPGSGRGGSRPIGPGHDEGDGIPGARPIGLGRGDGNSGFGPIGLGHGEDSRHIFFEAAPGAVRQFGAESPGQTGLAGHTGRPTTHPADPPPWGATFPRNLDGPVIPEPGDRDPETGRVDVDRISARIADRMVYGATGFVPASYAATGQPSRALTPDYLEPNTGARVPCDVDSETAHRAALQTSNNAGPASDEGAGVVTVAARQGGEGQEAQGAQGEGGGQVSDKPPVPGLKKGGDPANPHDYEYPKVGEPPNDPNGQRMRELIIKYANKYNVPVQLMFNKAHVESDGSWKTNLRSSAGATGLFQVMPGTFMGLGFTDPSSLEQNIEAACKLTAILLKQAKGDLFRAEIGWNWRPKKMYTNDELPLETWTHINKMYPGWGMDSIRNRKPRSVK